MSSTYPKVVAHIGVSVDDLDHAVKWYSEVLGFTLLAGPATIRNNDSHAGLLCGDIFPGFGELRVAHMATGNGVGFELFEWRAPKGERPQSLEYWRSGPFHIALVDPDLEGAVARITAAGGKLLSQVWQIFPDRPYRFCYCQDPFGITLEICTHSYEVTNANH